MQNSLDIDGEKVTWSMCKVWRRSQTHDLIANITGIPGKLKRPASAVSLESVWTVESARAPFKDRSLPRSHDDADWLK